MKFYIAGKIGEEKPSPATLAKFKAAEDLLRRNGYEVFNPTTSGLGKIADEKVIEAEGQGKKTTWYQEIMKLDIDALSFCDGIYLLENYKMSGGAMTEYQYSLATGKKFLFENIFHGVDFLSTEFDAKVNQGIIEVAPEKSYLKVREDWCFKNIGKVCLQIG